MENKFKINGLWYHIKYDKEKFIYSIVLYYGNIHKKCTLNNENFHDIFDVTKNQISRIVNSLKIKGYTLNE